MKAWNNMEQPLEWLVRKINETHAKETDDRTDFKWLSFAFLFSFFRPNTSAEIPFPARGIFDF
jgi:hypothetical protein